MVTLPAQAQHGLEKIVPAGGVDPGCPENDVGCAAVHDCLVSSKLASAVDIERPGWSLFIAGVVAAAVIDIIGGVVEDPDGMPCRILCQYTRQIPIDAQGCLHVSFRLVHCCIGCRVDDTVRDMHLQPVVHCGHIGEVELLACWCQDLPPQGKAAMQFKSNLSGTACEKYLHCCSRCVSNDFIYSGRISCGVPMRHILPFSIQISLSQCSTVLKR